MGEKEAATRSRLTFPADRGELLSGHLGDFGIFLEIL